jgi:hypothetical protein
VVAWTHAGSSYGTGLSVVRTIKIMFARKGIWSNSVGGKPKVHCVGFSFFITVRVQGCRVLTVATGHRQLG